MRPFLRCRSLVVVQGEQLWLMMVDQRQPVYVQTKESTEQEPIVPPRHVIHTTSEDIRSSNKSRFVIRDPGACRRVSFAKRLEKFGVLSARVNCLLWRR